MPLARFQTANNRGKTNEPERRVNVRPALTSNCSGEQPMAKSADTTDPIKRKCSVEGCERDLRPPSARGMCSLHYYRWKRHGDVRPRDKAPKAVCSVPHCGKAIEGRGLCRLHWYRRKRGTDLLAPMRGQRGALEAWLHQHSTTDSHECLVWPYGRTKGYGHLRFDGRQMGAHRAMCILAHGAPPFRGAQAAHSCGNGALGCVNPNHLRWATAKMNSEDRVEHGTQVRGEACGASVLTEAEVLAIIRDRRPSRLIASAYGVSATTVKDIRKRKIWKHVQTLPPSAA